MASSITRSALSSVSRVNYDFNRRICLMSFCRRLLTSPVLSTSAAPVERGARGPRRSKRQADEPRTQRMSADQDWTSVYPTAGVFRPAAVPLPVRMGYPVKRGAPPEKTGNLELMKIPNFLHLTPVAIRKHCESLKQFCTDWPSALDTDQKSTEHFPIQIQSKEFVSSGPSLRNPKSRIVTLQVKLSSLNLDDHARKKLIRLSGERYCRDSDTLTITTDSCPLKQQNYDYAMYLLTVLYHESWKTEVWEQEKTRADMEEYEWEGSPSQQNLLESLVGIRGVEEAELLGRPEVQAYRDALVQLKNQGENHHNLLQYKEAVKKLLSI